jgi:FkbM family methyltransferase
MGVLSRLRGRPAPPAAPAAPAPASTGDAIAHAAELVAHGPENAWTAPSRFGPPGIAARRALARTLRPYAIRQREVDAALLAGARELAGELAALRASVDELRARLGMAEAGVRTARPLALSGPLDGTSLVEAETDVGTLWLDRADTLLTPEILEHGRYDPQLVAYMRRVLRPGMTVVDIGANIGYFAVLAAALVGPTGRVLAVEPEPTTAAILAANLWRNGAHHAEVLPLAAMAHTGHVPLIINEDGRSGNWVLPGATDHGLVPCARLDDLLGDGPVHFVKTDAQGADHLAIRGMEATLARSPDASVVIEFSPTLPEMHGETPLEVLRYLQGLGFVMGPMTEEGEPNPMPPEVIMYLGEFHDWLNLVLTRP